MHTKTIELFKEAFQPELTPEQRRNTCRKALANAIHDTGMDIPQLWNDGEWKDQLSAPRLTPRGIASLFGKPHSMLVSALSIILDGPSRFEVGEESREKLDFWYPAMMHPHRCAEGSRGKVFGMHRDWDEAYFMDIISYAEALGIDCAASANMTPNKPASKPAKASAPAAGIETALNGLLGTVGLPEYSEISKTLDSLKDLKGEITAKDATIDSMKRQIDIASKATLAPVSVKGNGDVPDGKVEIAKAYDLFDVDAGDRSMFDFDLPHGVWDHDHPYVPDVDTAYVFDPETLIPVLLAVVNNRIPWLRGHTGTGKTTLAEQVYARLKLPVFRLNLDSDITRGELVGREVIRTDSDGKTVTEFVDGIIPMAMQQPCLLLLDEVDAARPDMGFVLQRLLEGKGFMLLEDGGRTVVPHQHFRMIATANTNGRGDETGLYSGTRALGTAFVNRFKPYIEVDYMTEDEEVELLHDKNPALDKDDCKTIARYATEHRTAFKQSDVTLACSPRDTLAFAASAVDYKRCFGSGSGWMMLALKHSILNAADSDDKQALEGLASRVIGGAV